MLLAILEFLKLDVLLAHKLRHLCPCPHKVEVEFHTVQVRAHLAAVEQHLAELEKV